MLTSPGRRGCGVRQQNGLYLCVGMTPGGQPIEDFVLDPCRPFRGRAFRAPILVEKEGQPNDVLIWIGAEYYFWVSDYLEESRQMGISRRIPRGFPLEGLVPFRSMMILVHSRAIPLFDYQVLWHSDSYPGPYSSWCRHDSRPHECTFNLWGLGLLREGEGHLVQNQKVTTPSVSYEVPVRSVFAPDGSSNYVRGAFAAFWITHLEYVNSDRRCPSELVQRAREVGMTLEVVEE